MNYARHLYREIYKAFQRRQAGDCAFGLSSALGLLAWSRRFLPEHFTKKPSKLHYWLEAQLDSMRRGTKLNVLAPRGSAKSTLASLAYPLREALKGGEPYIWLISGTMSQAHSHLENIKNALLKIEAAENFSLIRKTAKGSLALSNGSIIEAFGTGQQLRGRRNNQFRPTLIICDDIQDDQHILSMSARQRDRDWFHGTVLKAGSEQTNVVNLATALHIEAIAVELQTCPGWISKTFKAVEEYPQRMDLWKEWEDLVRQEPSAQASEAPLFSEGCTFGLSPAHTPSLEFYQQHKAEMDAGASVLWEEQEDLYALMKMRLESGYTAFEREKQNSPVNPALCEFPEDYFADIYISQKEKDLTMNPTTDKVSVLALDPSKGKDARCGDYSAYVYIEADGGFYSVQAWLERKPVSEMIQQGIELYRRLKPKVFGIEVNQFQELLADEFQRQGIPVFPIQNNVNKETRIRRLEPLLAQRKLKFAGTPGCQLLLDQLRMFPLGGHDDGPDALEMGIRMLNDLVCE